jgi:hypothetical protein
MALHDAQRAADDAVRAADAPLLTPLPAVAVAAATGDESVDDDYADDA